MKTAIPYNQPMTLDQMGQVGDIWRTRTHRLREMSETLPETDPKQQSAAHLWADMTLRCVILSMEMIQLQMEATQTPQSIRHSDRGTSGGI